MCIRDSYRESLDHYSRANQLLGEVDDTFGRAYSFCGMGNANRMMGYLPRALDYFARATELYSEIGDKVSYAWTLWGEGTALKMIRRLQEAEERFRRAQGLFSETGDGRGTIYCLLSLGEIRQLEGRVGDAAASLQRAEEVLEGKPFALERCHLRLYRWLLEGGDRGELGEIREAYRKLGSHFLNSPPTLPLNLP